MKMAYLLLQNSVLKIIILSTVLNLTFGDKLIGKYLKSKIRSYMSLTSNGINNKLWMEHLEKRLEIIIMHTSIHQYSLTQFYKRNLQREYFWKMYALCKEKYKKLQTPIFGTICASSEHGAEIPPPDACAWIDDAIGKHFCYHFRGNSPYFNKTVKTFIILIFRQ